MVTAENFRKELMLQMEIAAVRGQKSIVINVLELHVAVGVFAAEKHHTASNVMEGEMKAGDSRLVDRQHVSGLTIRYLLPRSPIFSVTE